MLAPRRSVLLSPEMEMDVDIRELYDEQRVDG